MEGWKGGGMESGKKNILFAVILTCPNCTYLLQKNSGTQEKWDNWEKWEEQENLRKVGNKGKLVGFNTLVYDF